MKWKGKINFADRPLYADYGLITVSETDTISGSLQTDIDTKSDNGHIHDDRYYTESEVDNLITTVSGKLDDHNELNNLDYVSAGHTGFQPSGNYATDSELTTLSGVLKNDIDGKSDIGHNHDDLYYTETELNEGQLDTRYYTESEVDTISGSLDTAKSDIDHSHIESDISNLDKYTQGEVDSLITTISGKLDDHNELNNLDYVSSGHTGFQSAGDYLTDSEFSTYSGTLQSQIDGKSDTSHLHDDRYYTESEIDTISGSLNTAKSDIDHSHTESDISDLDKYTQAETNTISGSLSSEIDSDISTHASNSDAHHTESHNMASHSDTTATGANLNTLVGGGDTALHKHDGQYYTESEVDTLITTISGKLDDHNELNNLDYVSSGHTGFQPAGDYAINSELTTLSGNLQTNIDGKDNYTSWSFAVDGSTKDAITSADVLDFVGGDNITITRSAEDQITISGSAGGGGGGLSWEVISTDTNAVNGSGYLINAGGGNITLTLPSSPSEGDSIGVCDIYEKATTNVITIARNGNNIEAAAEDLILDVDGSGFTSVYADATRGWEIVSEIGPGEDVVSDTVYGTTWSGVTGTAPSKNAVYDEMKLKADKGVNADITSMTGLNDDGIPVAKVSGAIETAALAGAVIADNKLIRGNGGVRGVQESTVIVDDSGRMTNPSQPAFLAYVNTRQDDVTGDGTDYDVTGAFWTELFDQGNNFVDGVFTAPVTGRYQLSGIIFVDGITSAMTSGNVTLKTSNRNYNYSINPYNIAYAGITNAVMMSFLCDLDANDTFKVRFLFNGGTKVVDVRTNHTYIAGSLIC